MHRVAARFRLHQLPQRVHQPRIEVSCRRPARTRLRHPPVRLDALLKLARTPRTVSGCDLVKAATRLIPPGPSARACAPSVSRHCRSSRCGFSSASMAAKRSSSTSTVAIPHTIGIRLGQTRVIQRRALRSTQRGDGFGR